MNYFVHANALCESSSIGAGSRIWAFAHILPKAKIGSECNICDHVFIENDVVIGDRVTVKCGVQLWDGLRVEDDVFIGPNVTFTNDMFPRSKVYPEKFLTTKISSGASIGANATILPGIKIGTSAMIGAGSVVTRDVPPNAKVIGNPARIIGYVETDTSKPPIQTKVAKSEKTKLSSVRGVFLKSLASNRDMRGNLNVEEFNDQFPFQPKRFFVISQVPSLKIRGEHAHKKCHQFLVCLTGHVSAMVDDGVSRETFELSSPEVGLYMPPMTWGTQFNYSPDATLAVFASEFYDPNDYIRDYSDFLELTKVGT